MISLYLGTPGSGKSLDMARKIVNAMRFHSDPVICNFDVNLSTYKCLRGKFLCIENADLTPERLVNFSINYARYKGRKLREGEILLFIDEAQLLFNCRMWGSNLRSEWIKFFSEHRKYGYDIVLATQLDKMLDKQLLGLVEFSYIHRKVSNYGFAGKVVSALFGGKLFAVVSMWYPMKLKIGNEMFVYRKKYSRIYDTLAVFD